MKAILASAACSAAIELDANAFLAAHRCPLYDRGSDVAALSFDDPDSLIDETQIIASHGIWLESDPRYKAAIAARGNQKYHLLYPASDAMSAAELAEHMEDARALLFTLRKKRGCKNFCKILKKITNGETITADDLRDWMPRAEQMAAEGRFE